MGEAVSMNLPWAKNIKLEKPSRSHTVTANTKSLVRNIVGVFLILALSILAIILLLFPWLQDLFRQVFFSLGISAALLSGLLLAIFLVSLPVFWLVHDLTEYRTARALDRRGIITKGMLMDTWVEEENGRPAFYIRYQYAIRLNAMQRVDRETFEQTDRAETLYVLHLEDQPQVSRLDLD